MRTKGRRRLDAVLLVVGGGIAAGATAIGAVVGNWERIDRMWVAASLQPGGGATVTEAIDYDFGLALDKHGIFRDVPGLSPQSPIAVHSATAPDDIAAFSPTFVGGEAGMSIKIGDADRTVTGRHRYLIQYPLATLQQGDRLAWDAVGTGWPVPISDAEVHVVAPWELGSLRCVVGGEGSDELCETSQPEPGHLVAEIGELDDHQGATIYAVQGSPLSAGAPPLPAPPGDAPPAEGAGILMPASVALVAGLGASASTSRFVRRAGRERVGAGGPTDAAWSDGGTSTSEVRLDADELSTMATTEFAPPEGVSAPLGGVVLAEAVRPEHRVAWLIEAAIEGAVELVEDGRKVRVLRTAPGAGTTKDVLDTMFGGRDEISLGEYDPTFAKGFSEIDRHLEAAARSEALWDPAGDRRRTIWRILGVVAAVAGLAAVGVGGALAARFGESWLALVVAGGVAGGIGWAAAIRGWELRVRTPKGSGLWLRVESFRRFLHDSEARHAEEAAERGVLREYTAWAVAVGEVDRWERAVGRALIPPTAAGIGYAHMAPSLMSSTRSASTAPSSSGSGGGGGGSVGGGGGGGGGGSW
ncbi:MAG: DUF2207 domain-containing protein [Acidimicrobiales bacterium]|nr:DUF2207 domain-containing protein [Acidimicrobiales bacterium]